MPMIKTIDIISFRQEFTIMGRRDCYSNAALETMFHYYDECPGTFELDVIAICCEVTEYEDFAALQADWGDELTLATYVDECGVFAMRTADDTFLVWQ